MNYAFKDLDPSPVHVETDGDCVLITFETLSGEEHTFRVDPTLAADLAWTLLTTVTPKEKA